jgi:hypothetical protein
MRVYVVLLIAVLCSCQRAKEGAKEALNTGGELAGKAAGEVLEGVKTGVEETWSVNVRLSPELISNGVSLGKVTVDTDGQGSDNLLVVYLTNERPLRDTLHVLAFDKDSLEMGRTTLVMDAEAGTGAFYEVQFPARTDLERKSTVFIR